MFQLFKIGKSNPLALIRTQSNENYGKDIAFSATIIQFFILRKWRKEGFLLSFKKLFERSLIDQKYLNKLGNYILYQYYWIKPQKN